MAHQGYYYELSGQHEPWCPCGDCQSNRNNDISEYKFEIKKAEIRLQDRNLVGEDRQHQLDALARLRTYLQEF